MKLYELLNAAVDFKELVGKHFTNFKMVRDLAKLKKQVDEEVNFYLEQDQKIRASYSTANSEEVKKMNEELLKLQQTEVENLSKVKITQADFINTADLPTPDQMLTLECLIDWEE